MFMNFGKKAVALLLAVGMLAVSGCDEQKESSPESSEVESVVVESNTSLTPQEQLQLLDDLDGKYKGRTFKIVTTETSLFENDAESPLGKAVSERITLIEQSLDVNVEIVEKSVSSLKEGLRKAKSEGKSYADMICAPAHAMAELADEGLLQDASSLPYLDLDANYVDKEQIVSQSASGKLYFLSGDATLNINSATVLFYDKKLLDSVGISPADKVFSGDFTWDELLSMINSVSTSGVKADYALSEEELYYSVYKSMGGSFIKTSEDGAELCYDSTLAKTTDSICNSLFKNAAGEDGGALVNFVNGKTAFLVARLDNVVNIAKKKSEWGILPLPKLYSGSSDYNCAVSASVASLGVPTACSDSAFSGFMLNAFLAASNNGLDEGLKSTYINYYFWSNDSARVLDLTEQSLAYDLGILYSSLPAVYDVSTKFLANDRKQTLEQVDIQYFYEFWRELF